MIQTFGKMEIHFYSIYLFSIFKQLVTCGYWIVLFTQFTYSPSSNNWLLVVTESFYRSPY